MDSERSLVPRIKGQYLMNEREQDHQAERRELSRLRRRVAELEAQVARDGLRAAGRSGADDAFSTIFLGSPDIQLILHVESGVIIMANKAVERVLKYNKEDLVGEHYSVLYPPEPETPREEFLDRITVYDSVLEGQHLVRSDGSLFPAELTATLIPWESGEALLVTFRDVSERIRAQQALKESEEKYRHLAELLPGIVFEIDLRKKFTFVNRCGLETIGYRVEEIADEGTPLYGVIPEHRARFSRDIDKVFAGESLAGNEYTSLRKDGSTLPVMLYATPIVRDRRIVGLRGVGLDITDLKRTQEALEKAKQNLEKRVAERTAELAESNEQLRREVTERTRAQEALTISEQRFRAIFDTAIDCVFIKNASLHYTLVNPATEQLLSIPSSAIIGKTDFDLFGPAAGEHLKAVDERVLKGEFIEEEHTRLVKGSPTTFLDVRAPMQDACGTIIGICGISRNITERRETQAAPRSDEPDYPAPAMKKALDQALSAAQSDTTTLITGESGSGKDFLARYIHERSKRGSGPFYAINCAALPPDLAESELFGHEAGAFTGANRAKRGLLELAEGGTLLLNEIGELSPGMQAKLLSFMDTKTFTRVGGEKCTTVNARLLAATNRDLEKEVAKGRFRVDLFYRLNVLRIRVPPLRERLEDIPILVNEILTRIAFELQLTECPEIDPSNMVRLAQYSWPGNVRELRNVLERVLIVSGTGPLHFDSLSESPDKAPAWSWQTGFPPELPFTELVKSLKRAVIQEALARTGGKKTETARLLGITRHILRRQIEAAGPVERRDGNDPLEE
ncbi:MAG: sigma 54-interacting transcriptional regulator [Desulfomonilaceae bacterium]|nr:sigma 54-interacting transcriptional regulator [Desulfomonilaceae bacterium]